MAKKAQPKKAPAKKAGVKKAGARKAAAARPPSKVPFFTVVERVQKGTITDAEVADYFGAQQNPNTPFEYFAGINTNRVDISQAVNSSAFADALLRDVSQTRDGQLAKTAAPAGWARKSPIVAEGDSWFNLPSAIMPQTLVDVLQRPPYGYAVANLAHWGDTLDDIILNREFWGPLLSGRADTLMFSAGGNDVLGGGALATFLNLFDVDHTKPSDAAYYIKPAFYDNLKRIVGNYEALLQSVQLKAKDAVVIGHGYDYVIPMPEGPWLGKPMLFVGLDCGYRPQLCRNIARIMIDAWNDALKGLASVYPNYQYVDCRGAVKDWFDELHPKQSSAKVLAGRFDKVLRKLPASNVDLAPHFHALAPNIAPPSPPPA